MFNKQYITILALAIVSLLVACKADGDFPGRTYMPDMAYSQAYEAYTKARPIVLKDTTIELFADGKSARQPVAGTIPRGHVPYYYPDTPEGYEAAGKEVFNPFNDQHDKVLTEGEAAFTIYCAVCHGAQGNGKGTLVQNGVYPTVPSYFDVEKLQLSEGQMFHSIHHGKNLMGSYASQLTKEERWKVISYIKQMQAEHINQKTGMSVKAALAQITGEMTYNHDAATGKAKPKAAEPASVEESVDNQTEVHTNAETKTDTTSSEVEIDIEVETETE